MAGIFGYYLRSKVTKYVILFIERDGSTYLTSLLSNHPDVHANYEQFAVLRQKGCSGREQLNWAAGFLNPPLISRHSAVGFKTKLVDVLDREGFVALLKSTNCRIIHMQRRNQVKAAVSRINAKRLHDASGAWNLYKEADRMPPTTVDAEQFAKYLRQREEADQELNDFVGQLKLPTLKLVYEELLTNRPVVIASVFNFLRIRALPIEGKTLKHTSDNLRDVILNFDELRQGYQGTRYDAMFDEVLASRQPDGEATCRA